MGGLKDAGSSVGFALDGAGCVGFDELGLLTSPLVAEVCGPVDFLGRRKGILHLVCFFSYNFARSATNTGLRRDSQAKNKKTESSEKVNPSVYKDKIHLNSVG